MENTSPTNPPARTAYTAEQQAIIDSLRTTQEQLGLSDEKFARQYLRSYSASTWSRIRDGLYGAKDQSKVFAELDRSLRSIRLRMARQAKQSGGSPFYELPQCLAIFEAVTDCLEKRGENRLIVYAAPTGGGKSRTIAELSTRETCSTVRANEPWRTSYYFAALDIITALGGTGKYITAGDARRELIALLKEKKQILAIDEGNYFGTQSINLVKDILNETESVVLLCCTPAHFDKMKRFWAEWAQLQRRVHTVFRAQPITPDESVQFLTTAGLNGDSRQAAILLARAANEFGAYDFIERVIQRLEESTTAKPAIADVEAAIAFVKAQLDIGGR